MNLQKRYRQRRAREREVSSHGFNCPPRRKLLFDGFAGAWAGHGYSRPDKIDSQPAFCFHHSPIMKKYNVGIIGYGWAAGAHIDSINKTPHAQVTAVFSTRKLDDKEISAKHGGKIKSFTDYEAFLASDIDVVDICSMPSMHA